MASAKDWHCCNTGGPQQSETCPTGRGWLAQLFCAGKAPGKLFRLLEKRVTASSQKLALLGEGDLQQPAHNACTGAALRMRKPAALKALRFVHNASLAMPWLAHADAPFKRSVHNAAPVVPWLTHTGAQFKRCEPPGSKAGYTCSLASSHPSGSSVFEESQYQLTHCERGARVVVVASEPITGA